MLKNKKYFTKGQYLFWLLILLLVSFAFLHLADKMFKEEGIVERIIEEERPPIVDTTSIIKTDTTKKIINDSILFKWEWNDYNDKKRVINFKLSAGDLQKATANRINYPFANRTIWKSMFKSDFKYLKSLIYAYKKGIEQNNLTNLDALDYVISSIQYIGYTWICAGTNDSKCGNNSAPLEECKPKNIGGIVDPGCCDNIIPYAVYSPFEFAYYRTGDCDTKALFAYTILKGLGYNNVCVIHGDTDRGKHAMLGIKIPNPPFNRHFIRDYNGQKIYAWETTANNFKLGQKVWDSWTNWEIGLE